MQTRLISADIVQPHPGLFVLSGSWTARAVADRDQKLTAMSASDVPEVVVDVHIWRQSTVSVYGFCSGNSKKYVPQDDRYVCSTSLLNITVETKEGVVKLEGKAGSWIERNLATKRVIDVHGVMMVFKT